MPIYPLTTTAEQEAALQIGLADVNAVRARAVPPDLPLTAAQLLQAFFSTFLDRQIEELRVRRAGSLRLEIARADLDLLDFLQTKMDERLNP